MTHGFNRASTRISRRILDAIVLGSWLAAVCWLLITGNDGAFLHPRFRPFLIGGAVLLLAFMAARLATPMHPGRASPWPTIVIQMLIVMLPLCFLIAAANQGMGTHALNRRYTGRELQTLSQLLAQDRPPDRTDQEPVMTVLEIARRMNRLAGRRVVTEGFVYRPAIMPPDTLTLFRFAIFCCAADALPVWLFVEQAGLPALADEAWIEVEGVVTVVNFNGTDVPVIKADRIVEKAAPHPNQQYLFF